MASGFRSGSLPHLKYFNDTITLPSLHIFGENDQIIPTGKVFQCFIKFGGVVFSEKFKFVNLP